MEPANLCNLFYASHFLPIACYHDGHRLALCTPCSNEIDLFEVAINVLRRDSANPAVYTSPRAGLYGRVRMESTGDELILGPIFERPVTEESVSGFLHSCAIPIRYKTEVRDMLRALPQLTYNQFLSLLAFLHLTLNGKTVKLEQLIPLSNERTASVYADSAWMKYVSEGQTQHGTYRFEEQMLSLVRSGQPQQLQDFLLESAKQQKFLEGTLADAPLRQAKNLFIGLVALVGKRGAIPGGLDVEQSYRLIDLYTQGCEKLQSVDAIKALQLEMLLDFAERVRQNAVPTDISPEIYRCVCYIRDRTNDRICVNDVAACIGKSRSYTTRKFRAEMRMSIAQYITQCRLSDAKDLLLYTDRSLSEISSFLCFSSQAHFQSAFKKEFGNTPAAWRRAKQPGKYIPT